MSVDLDSLINQSKQRLSKHKEYLEKTSQRTGYSSTNNNVAAIDASAATNSSSARRGEELSFSPLRPEERQQPQQQPLFPNSSNQQHTGFSPLTSNGQPQYNTQQQTPQQQPQFNPYSSNVARAGYTNYGEPEQQHLSHNRHNTSSSSSRAGFYLSSRTPTKVYDRGQKFVESRESYLERQRQEAWEKEMKGCTFSPFISRKAATMKSSGGNGGKSPSPEKPSANNNRGRSADESSHNDEPEMDHQEFLDWCVHSDKTNVGFHVDAPSVFLHIQRQQDARKQRADGQAKLTVDTAHWRPKVTVPQEFHFGRSDQPIRSLKKPIMNMVRLSSGDTVGSRSGSAAGGARSSKSPASRRGTPRASKSPLRLTKKNVNASNLNDDDDEAESEEAERQRIAKLKQMELNNRDQQKQLREQSEEIQKLSGMLSAMKMEAEAAKAKVREMTLSQTISGEK